MSRTSTPRLIFDRASALTMTMANFFGDGFPSQNQPRRSPLNGRLAVLCMVLLLSLGSVSILAQTPMSPAVPVFAYSANNGDNTVSIYKVNETTGQLTGISYASVGSNPGSVAVASPPTGIGTFLYVANNGSNDISEFRINTTDGTLAPVGSGSISSGIFPTVISVDPTNQYVYVTNAGDTTVSAFAIQNDGSLMAIGSPVQAGQSPISMTTVKGPNVNFAYAVSQNNNMVTAFLIQSDGTLLPNPAQPAIQTAGVHLQAVQAMPNGTYLYVGDNGSSVIAYQINQTDGSLTQPAALANPFATGAGAFSIAIDSTGNHLYTANSAAQSVSAFAIGPDGSLNQRADTAVAGGGPTTVQIDLSGKFLYVLDQFSNLSQTFAITLPRSPSGFVSLTAVSSGFTRSLPISLAFGSGTNTVSINNELVYVTNLLSNSISALNLSPQTGATSLQTPSSYPSVAALPNFIIASPSGQDVLISNGSDQNGKGITEFSVASSGALTSVLSPPLQLPNFGYAVTIDPSGRFFYAANERGNQVLECPIAPAGLLGLTCNALVTPLNPGSLATDPLGQFLFVLGEDSTPSNVVYVYSISLVDGTLTPISGSPFAAGGSSALGIYEGDNQQIAVHPSGSFVAIMNATSRTLSVLSSDGLGTLTLVSGYPLSVSGQPESIVFDPSGKYLYLTDYQNKTIVTYQFSPSGTLTSPVTISSGGFPVTGIVDPSGQYFLLTSYDNTTTFNGSFTAFSIDPSSGTLTLSLAPVPLQQLDPASVVAIAQYTILPILMITTTSIPTGTAGVPYTSGPISTTGGTPPTTFSEMGTLPAGLTFDPTTGTLSGTPTQVGVFQITIAATDAGGVKASHSYTLQIICPTITVAQQPLVPGTVGQLYISVSLAEVGGILPVTLTESGPLAGLSLSPTGLLSGAPTLAGSFNFNLTATDVNGCSSEATLFTLSVNKGTPVITWVPPAPIAQGTALSLAQLDATTNITGSFTYTPAAGTVLSPGLGQTLSVLFTPSDSADYNTATASVQITVNPAAPPPVLINVNESIHVTDAPTFPDVFDSETIAVKDQVTVSILQSIVVSTAQPILAVGAMEQLTATGTFSDGSTQNLTASVLWSSSRTAVATIKGSIASGISPGSTSIKATLGSTIGSTNLTVRPPFLSIAAKYASIAQDSNGNYVVTISVTNTGDISANNVALFVGFLGTEPSASSTPATNVAPGAIAALTMVFPGSTGKPESKQFLLIVGLATGNNPDGTTASPAVWVLPLTQVTLP